MTGQLAAGAPPASAKRVWAAVATTLLVLAVAVIGGLLSSPSGGTPLIFVERLSSAISDFLSRAGGSVWWVYAFLLGVVAAFNPCGFALLPSYLGLYLNDQKTTDESLPARVRRSLSVSAVVAGSFTLLFGVMGALFSLAASPIVRSLPWAGLGVGVVLILAGGVILAGKPVGSTFPQQVAGRVGRHASRSGIRGYAAFGLAYGLASLGCALPLFLALLGTAVAAGGPWTAAEAFALYGAGMATTLGLLTLAAALISFGILARVRGVGRFVSGLGAVLLLASGGYVVYYWLTAGRVLLT